VVVVVVVLFVLIYFQLFVCVSSMFVIKMVFIFITIATVISNLIFKINKECLKEGH